MNLTLTKRPTPIPPAIPRPVPKPAMTMAEYAKIESRALKDKSYWRRDLVGDGTKRGDVKYVAPQRKAGLKRAVDALKAIGRPAPITEIAAAMNVSESPARRQLARLVDTGEVTVTGRGTRTDRHFYSLTGKGEAV